MKSPAILSENRFLGSITSSSIRNLLPKSIISAKQKSTQDPETKISRSNDENSIPVDPNRQADDHHHSTLQCSEKSPTRIQRSETNDGETLSNEVVFENLNNFLN